MRSIRTSLAVSSLLALSGVAACDPVDEDDDRRDRGEGEGEGEGESDGPKLPVTDNAWTYTDVDGAACGNGTPVGVAVNRGTSSRLVIYLEGGGACWEQLTCDNNFATFVKTGIDASTKQAILNNRGGPFNRASAANPFSTDSYAYIPYCTGDLHAGTQASNSHGVQHVGGNNFALMLPLILNTFPDVEEVVLAGTSAGGYGAIFNAERVKAALADDVDFAVIMDSAIPLPPFPGGGEDIQAQQLAAWQPDVCDGCTGVEAVFEHAQSTLSSTTFGMTMSTGDSTLRQFFTTNGFSPIDATTWGTAVNAFVETHEADNFATFIEDSQRHVFIYESFDISVGDVSLAEFYAGVIGDGPLVSTGP